MNLKKLFFAAGALGMLLLGAACQDEQPEEPNGNTPQEPGDNTPSTPTEETVPFTFTVSDPSDLGAENLGVLLFYEDGTRVNETLIQAEPDSEESGVYGFEAEVNSAKTVDRMLVIAPCNSDLELLDEQHSFGQMIPTVQQPAAEVCDADADVLAALVTLDDGPTTVELTSVATSAELSIQGLDDGEKIRSVGLSGSAALSGFALVDWEREPLAISGFAADRSWNSLTAIYPEGLAAATAHLLTVSTGLVSPDVLIITDSRLVKIAARTVTFSGSGKLSASADLSQATSEKALTFDFLKSDGMPAATLEEGSFSLQGSTGETLYRFNAPQCSLDAETGLCMKGDMATPGTLSIPNIDGRQVTRIVLSLDTRTEMAAHALWLETFNGESWDKIDGTDKSVSLETALQNGGYIEFEIPKKNVSAIGQFRIAKGVEGVPTCVRSMTLVHEEKSCTFDPASVIPNGFESGWRRYGTSSSPDNNYDQEKVLVIDPEESHVDDGTGSLRIGGVNCLNSWKPWQSWAYQDIPVQGGEVYRISVCIKTENMPTTANVYLGLGYKDANNQWMKGWIEDNATLTAYNHVTSPWVDTEKGTHDWIRLTAEETVPEGAVKMGNLQVRLDNVITASDAYVWFDDIQMVKISE